MPLFSPADRHFAQQLSLLAYCNPFLPCRIEYERAALGERFDAQHADWNVSLWSVPMGLEQEFPNVLRLIEQCRQVLERTERKLTTRSDRTADELVAEPAVRPPSKSPAFEGLLAHARRYLHIDGQALPLWHEMAHMIACFFQIHRAFVNIFEFIIGASQPAVQLRAAIWQSIFTHDMRRYRRVLFDRMADYTTLVMGPSGTGKELVARAVGLSRYVPFDLKSRRFTEDFAGSFFPLNLSALSPTLIESELFGHKRGSFTGAVEDRAGWLEVCPAQGTVFLDEIGELDPAIQVKLLRVLQDRSFSRLGETKERRFQGKLIAATNRDLAEQMRRGGFREDFYYRLCSDIIVTPSLRQRLADNPAELRRLVLHIAQRMVSDEAESVTSEVLHVIETQLGRDYSWPGNVRELEQCVRNVLVRREYRPPSKRDNSPPDQRQALLRAVEEGRLTADELVQAYCALVYAETGSYEATARRIGLDRRTVKAKVDAQRPGTQE
jgi:transcriptional regulator with AAA-type ATPase domain